jgi:Ca2+-binding EF-hand superfamily protein
MRAMNAHDAWLLRARLRNVLPQVDDDHSGLLTFDELDLVARRKMKITKKEMSDDMLKALWCSMDEDNNNNIDVTEFVRLPCLRRAIAR